ncbi:MAG TPA: Ada metal-binding domain-containing protein [Pyrinomonadaceae bacterium]|nr:Ada metal-binding domain-containing protein [Pyrinomonadaceae bacterium]
MQCPKVCFSNPLLHETLPAFDRLGMPLVTSGQFAYVFKLKQINGPQAFAVRCFRGFLGDRAERYQAIDAHLRAHTLPALAGFQYDPEGIFVGGRRFPTLVMEWIDGPTLDVYLEEVVGRGRECRDVLLHLADEWVRLCASLREREVAHGDLQHGNVIVEGGRLRLVDLDGLYVPAMDGWGASEIGHQHYQHPTRDEKFFGPELDNFSALVIYLSLISLAERPALWREHHDENLLFTKDDFLAPDRSALFAKIRDLGPEQNKLVEVLATAAGDEPRRTPFLTDLVEAKTKLPSWMHAPSEIAVATRTREAAQIEVPLVEASAQTDTARRRASARAMPSTPNSSQVQSVFSGAGGAVTGPPPPQPFAGALGVDQVMPAAFYYGKKFGKTWIPFIWVWLTLGRHIYEFAGIGGGTAILLTALTFPLLCYAVGLGRAVYQGRAALFLSPHSGNLKISSSAPSHLLGSVRKSVWPTFYQTPPFSSRTSQTGSIVASRTQGIYHQLTCDWAAKISPGNRVAFATTGDAQTAGYRRCKVCLP